MKSHIGYLAGIGLLYGSFSLPVLAQEQGTSPLQSRPDEVRQTQQPRTGYYEDIPWRNQPGLHYRPYGPRYGQEPARRGDKGYDVFAYPVSGQGPQQQEHDRYQCHRWAVQQTGFDPAAARHAPAARVADGYRRALGACLSGRGYSIN